MSRDSNGTHTLPTGNPVVSGSAISSSVHNATLTDLSSEITDSLSRSGKGGMSAALLLADGTKTNPGVGFVSDPDTGIYRSTTNTLAVSAGDTKVLEVAGSGLSVTTGLVSLAATGATANKVVSFVADGATAVGLTVDTDAALANSAAKLVSFQNNSVEKAFIGEDGAGSFYGAAMGSQKVTGVADGTTTGDAIHYGQLVGSAVTLTAGTNWGTLVYSCRQLGKLVYFNINGITAGVGAAWSSIITGFPAPAAQVTFLGVSYDGGVTALATLYTLSTGGVLAASAYDDGTSLANPMYTIGTGDIVTFSGVYPAA